MAPIGRAAVEAAQVLALAGTEQKNAALTAAATALRTRTADILAANAREMKAGEAAGLSGAMLDRLKLDAARIETMARGVEQIAALPDPVGTVIAEWERPNGLRIKRVRVPLGVIGIIYESRPNVTIDSASLCLKTGNSVVLRGGSDAINSNKILTKLMREAAYQAGIPDGSIQLIEDTSRTS